MQTTCALHLNKGSTPETSFSTIEKDSFDVLHAEGAHTPRILSVGLNCRLVGHPGRIAALARFLDYISKFEQVWVARRIDIAQQWQKQNPVNGD